MKGPVFSVPVGEIKPQGVYDIPPTKGVSELPQSSKKGVWVCVCVFIGVIQEGQSKGEKPVLVRVNGKMERQ